MSFPIERSEYKVGEARIKRVMETVLTALSPADLYPGWSPSDLDGDLLRLVLGPPEEKRERLILNVNVWVVEFRGKVFLIDAGIGNGKDRPFSKLFHRLQTPFADRLEAVGIHPGQVDYVLLTHLHVDHVGWNTRKIDGRWKPTFPNAKYVFSQAEKDYFSTPASESRRVAFEDSVLPVIQAGQAEIVGDPYGPYLDGVELLPSPGHSPGHMSISIKSRGEEAIFIGDILHNPIQVHRPNWNSVFCADPEQAIASRRWTLDYAARRKAILFAAHLPETSAGVVLCRGDGYEWRYV